MTRRMIASLTVAAAALLAPQAASAADLYVGPNDGDADCSYNVPCTLWSAIGRADRIAGRDTIHVGGSISEGISADLTRSPIDLVGSPGAGIDFADGTMLLIGQDSSASGLRVRGQRHAVTIEHGGQLRDSIVEVLARDDTTTTAAVTVGATGAPTRAAVIARVGIDAPGGSGVVVEPARDFQQVQIVGADIQAAEGITGSASLGCGGLGGFALQSSTIVAWATAVRSYCNGEIVNSVVRTTSPGRVAVGVLSGHASIRHSTIVGAGPGTGTDGYAVLAGAATDVDLSESIFTGFDIDLFRLPGPGSFRATRSSFTSSAGRVQVVDPAPGGDPQFVDAAAGDYRLSDRSPLIDAGFEAQPGAAQTDRAGANRFADGNGDGKAESDIGAYEHPSVERPAEPTAPTTPGDQSRPGGAEPQGRPADETRPLAPPRLTFAGRTLSVDTQRRARLQLGCQAQSRCDVKVVLTAVIRGRTVTLARGSGAPASSTLRVQLRLSLRALALVRRYRVRSVQAAVTAQDAGGGTTRSSRAYALRVAR